MATIGIELYGGPLDGEQREIPVDLYNGPSRTITIYAISADQLFEPMGSEGSDEVALMIGTYERHEDGPGDNGFWFYHWKGFKPKDD